MELVVLWSASALVQLAVMFFLWWRIDKSAATHTTQE